MKLQSIELFTSEVFARRFLNSGYDVAFVTWAENMVLAGFESEHLIILLGEIAPFNGFEMDALLDRIQDELKAPKVGTVAEAIRIITTAHVLRFVRGLTDSASTMSTLAELYGDDDNANSIYDFYLLHYAANDLGKGEDQYYWPDANRTNIERIIKDRCLEWVRENPLEVWQDHEWPR
jgi:hypothetical protein